MNVADDPGWRPALRPWWKLMLPWFVLEKDERRPPLLALRRRYLHMGILLVDLCLGVQWVFEGRSRSISPALWVVVGAAAAWSIGASAWLRRAPAAPAEIPATAEVLATQFRARSFIQLGLAIAPALWGIGGSFIAERPQLSWLGTALSLILLAWVAPTRSRIDAIDERLRLAGAPVSLWSALLRTPS